MSSNKLIISRLTINDLLPVMSIEQRSHSHPAAETHIRTSLAGEDLSYGAYVDNTLVGFYLASQVIDELTLIDIAVDPQHQGAGVGRALLKDMLCRGEQSSALHFFLEVRASNKKAQRLYASEGFNELGVRRGYYPAAEGREDAVIMGLSLAM
jgi:ribosomal-protein-alanine N-acetyltransferase